MLTGKIEGYSYLVLLFIAMPMKYAFAMPMAVKVCGMIHGLLFVLFMISIAVLLSNKLLSFKGAVYAFLLSLLPFGTFYLDRLFKK